MTTDLVEKCAIASAEKMNCGCFIDAGMTRVLCDDARLPDAEPRCDCRRAALAVIDALADGVNGAMVDAAVDEVLGTEFPGDSKMQAAIAAAIRAAKSRDETTPPPKD